MANEAIKITLYGENGNGKAVDVIVASNAAIPYGTLLALTGDRTVTSHASVNQVFWGVNAADKSASDTAASTSSWQDGEFDMAASGTIVRGQYVKLSGSPNMVMAATEGDAGSSYSRIVGRAIDTASGGRVAVRINI